MKESGSQPSQYIDIPPGLSPALRHLGQLHTLNVGSTTHILPVGIGPNPCSDTQTSQVLWPKNPTAHSKNKQDTDVSLIARGLNKCKILHTWRNYAADILFVDLIFRIYEKFNQINQ